MTIELLVKIKKELVEDLPVQMNRGAKYTEPITVGISMYGSDVDKILEKFGLASC